MRARGLDVPRRAVLVGSGALAAGGLIGGLGGCDDDTVATRPGDALLAAALVAEDELLRLYAAALAGTPAADPAAHLLRRLRDDHQAHRDALVAAGVPGTPTSSPTATPRGSPSRRTLVAAERRAAEDRSAAALAAPRVLVPLLASIAASEASHGVLLRRMR